MKLWLLIVALIVDKRKEKRDKLIQSDRVRVLRDLLIYESPEKYLLDLRLVISKK